MKAHIIKNKEIENKSNDKLVDKYIRNTIISRMVGNISKEADGTERKYSAGNWKF